jgi:superfamily II DNA or RNA helicase
LRGVGQAEVWDLEVEEANCFYANGVLVHNCHHMKADEWRKPLLCSDIWGRIGLSATLFEDPGIPQERAAIWVRGVVGPTVCEIPVSRLIEQGHLVQPWVLIYPITHVGAKRSWRGGQTYTECVVEGVKRNGLITRLAREAAARGALVLIDTGRLKQMVALRRALEEQGVACAEIHGKTPSAQRQRILAKFRDREISVLIGTVLDELERRDAKRALVTMCAAGGMAPAIIIERV